MRFAPGCFLKSLLVLLLFAGLLVEAAPTFAADGCTSCNETACCCEERHDDIWSISTRCAPCCVDDQEAADPTIVFKRFDASCGCWKDATAEEFFGGADAMLPTTFWVHGDRIEDDDVYEVGMAVYDRLVECQAAGRIRYVIWSWSAATVYPLRPFMDARQKGTNGLQDSYRLGWVLARMPADTSVSLVGYSAAGRIIYGALHGLGGGMVAGYGLLDENHMPGPPRYSVVTFATAIDNNWLEPGERFGLAVSQVKRLLLVNNGRDMILRHYPQLSGGHAVGLNGLANCHALGEHADRVTEINVCDMIGPLHRWRNYVFSDTVIAMIRDYSLPCEEVVVEEIADGGDVEFVDGSVVVVEDIFGRKQSAVEMVADGGDVETVDGVAVVVEDAFGRPSSAVESVADAGDDEVVDGARVFIEVTHREKH